MLLLRKPAEVPTIIKLSCQIRPPKNAKISRMNQNNSVADIGNSPFLNNVGIRSIINANLRAMLVLKDRAKLINDLFRGIQRSRWILVPLLLLST